MEGGGRGRRGGERTLLLLWLSVPLQTKKKVETWGTIGWERRATESEKLKRARLQCAKGRHLHGARKETCGARNDPRKSENTRGGKASLLKKERRRQRKRPHPNKIEGGNSTLIVWRRYRGHSWDRKVTERDLPPITSDMRRPITIFASDKRPLGQRP